MYIRWYCEFMCIAGTTSVNRGNNTKRTDIAEVSLFRQLWTSRNQHKKLKYRNIKLAWRLQVYWRSKKRKEKRKNYTEAIDLVSQTIDLLLLKCNRSGEEKIDLRCRKAIDRPKERSIWSAEEVFFLIYLLFNRCLKL